MVFLNVEDLNSKRFQTHISSLVARKQELSFFLDEAHLLVLEEDFRYALKYIQEIVRFRQQLVFISATLPDCLLNVLESKFCLTGNQIIRGSTTRTNVTYSIRFLNRSETHLEVLQVLYQELVGRLAPGEKIIIFCPSKDDCEFLSRELGISCYYSNKEDKELILRRFESDPEVTTIARTTALGVGIDLPGIRFSIHLYKISSLIAFDQEVGRIGRDSQPSISYILANKSQYSTRPTPLNSAPLEKLRIINQN